MRRSVAKKPRLGGVFFGAGQIYSLLDCCGSSVRPLGGRTLVDPPVSATPPCSNLEATCSRTQADPGCCCQGFELARLHRDAGG